MIKIQLSDSDFQKAIESDKYGWCFIDAGNSEKIHVAETKTTYVVPKIELENGNDFIDWHIGQRVELHNNNAECVGKVSTFCIHKTFIEVFIVVDLILL
jgi:hypothetical protein